MRALKPKEQSSHKRRNARQYAYPHRFQAAMRPRMRVAEQDIASLDVDAVVNAANDHLWMGAGVAGALKRAGGDEIEREAMAKGPIKVGEAVVTSGGRLRARHVIHAAVMGQFLRTSAPQSRARRGAPSRVRRRSVRARSRFQRSAPASAASRWKSARGSWSPWRVSTTARSRRSCSRFAVRMQSVPSSTSSRVRARLARPACSAAPGRHRRTRAHLSRRPTTSP